MSTIYNFDEELPSATGGAAISDSVFVHQASSGAKKQMTVSKFRLDTIETSSAATGFTTSAEGTTYITATTSGLVYLGSPTSAGLRKRIVWTQPRATVVFQVSAQSSALATSPTFGTATALVLNLFSTAGMGMELVSLTTAMWGISGLSLIGAQATSITMTTV